MTPLQFSAVCAGIPAYGIPSGVAGNGPCPTPGTAVPQPRPIARSSSISMTTRAGFGDGTRS
ncbi:hypothetical protein GCM10018783_51250 [Streptomyces griseosporeus]|nr:hypothetical protein GCM10018783_51250 [Streptomyces griseosporeus]